MPYQLQIFNPIFMNKIGGVSYSHHQDFTDDCHEYKYIPHILQPTSRTIAIGDIHGDLNVSLKALIISKCIKKVNYKNNNTVSVVNKKNTEYYEWIGNDTQVVQVGDQVDSCRPTGDESCEDKNTTKNDEASDIKILHLYTDLDTVARNFGGKVISLFGNHELMNVLGNMKYVSYKNIMLFADKGDDIKTAIRKRKAAFSNKTDLNGINHFLACTRTSSIIIGTLLFVHGGMVNNMAEKYHISDINLLIRKWLLGKLEDEIVYDIIKNNKKISDINVEKELKYLVGSHESMFWNRALGYLPKDSDNNDTQLLKNCDEQLQPMFDSFVTENVNGIVIGHTPQNHHDGINSTCNQRVWRVDIGAAKAFDKFNGHKKLEVLEITYDKNNAPKFNVIKE